MGRRKWSLDPGPHRLQGPLGSRTDLSHHVRVSGSLGYKEMQMLAAGGNTQQLLPTTYCHSCLTKRDPCSDMLGEVLTSRLSFSIACVILRKWSEVTQSCLTLSNLMDCSLPGSSVHGIFQARVLEWGAVAFSNRPYSSHKIFSFSLKHIDDSVWWTFLNCSADIKTPTRWKKVTASWP